MIHYFYLLEERFYWQRMRPLLARCRRERSFRPCQRLCQELAERAIGHSSECLIAQAAEGRLAYQAGTWTALVGELFVAGAQEVPRIPLEPCLLCRLVAGVAVKEIERRDFAPIHQALYGAHDLDFGIGVYRPDHAGINHVDDARRLTDYLQSVDPTRWTAAAAIDADDVADAQSWWPELVAMYERALAHGWLVLSEEP